MEVEPINATRIYKNVIGQFVGLVRDGKLKAGEKCPSERTLAEMFGVSRASIREAFRAMEIIGLLEVRHGEGSFITDLNIAPFLNTIAPLLVRNGDMERELLEFRSTLEREAVRRIAQNPMPEGLERLSRCLGEMAVATEKGDASAGVEADIRFHMTLFAICGNYFLRKSAECIGHLLESSVRFNRGMILHDAGDAAVLLEQHRRIHGAMAAGRVEEAVQAMTDHLDSVRYFT